MKTLRLGGIALFTVLAAIAGWFPTVLRFDVVAVGAGWLLGVVPGVLGITATATSAAVRHHDHWRALAPSVMAVMAGTFAAWYVRRPRPADRLPSRSAARLLALVPVALVLGMAEHTLAAAHHDLDVSASLLPALGLLCGMVLVVALAIRPRNSDIGPVFVAAGASAVTIAVVLITIGLWDRQDEDMLHSTADSASLGFLSTLAEEMNVLTTKADTSVTEPFTPERFPALMQTIVFGHEATPGAALVEVSDGQVEVLAAVSSLGGEFETELGAWTNEAADGLAATVDSGVVTYLGMAALPRPTGGNAPYLVYAAPLAPIRGQEAGTDRVLVVTMSIPVMLRSSLAPTLATSDEAVVTLYSGTGVDTQVIASTRGEVEPFTTVEVPPADRTGKAALSPMSLNDTEFTFVAEPGIDFGTPLSFRRLVIALEVAFGVLIVAIVLVNGDHRTRQERERLRREGLLAAALAGSPGWTAIVDQADRVVMANASALGVGAGGRVDDVPLWSGDTDATQAIRALLADARAGNVSSMQHVWSAPDDHSHAMRIMEIDARPLPDPGLVYLQCVDVTEHRDRAMRTAQSERMEAIGVLAGGLAHDFNNLLFITLGYLQMLERQPTVTDDAQSRIYVQRAIEAVERGAVVAKSLLSFARSQPLTAVPVNLGQFLDDLRPLIEQALGTAHQLDVQIEGDGLDVVVDPGRLSSSVLNAVFNARDAMEGRGRVTIGIERCVAAPLGGDAVAVVALSVRDSGRGMAPEVVARAFEPFFTTKQIGSGTGLGLSTLYSFAQQSGGWAAIESTEGSGTTVTIFLPPALEALPDDLPQRRPRTATRALVVDDESALADLVAGWLEDLGMETRVATTPDAALTTAESFHPDLLVSDANLGATIDGLELARILVQRDPALLVVFMTGFSDRIRALQAAGVATLAKPFSRDDLVASLSTHLGDLLDHQHGRST
jgi:signal transduction histidine kinase/ActR/RegA family two-component response regulator